mmetsp:Transcript_4162/g.26351  ORF Transcript_4162/g.26351 Transcript_4162/m.26351 type:complete len:97 (-) Transcript_4162:1519-1809(-)
MMTVCNTHPLFVSGHSHRFQLGDRRTRMSRDLDSTMRHFYASIQTRTGVDNGAFVQLRSCLERDDATRNDVGRRATRRVVMYRVSGREGCRGTEFA